MDTTNGGKKPLRELMMFAMETNRSFPGCSTAQVTSFIPTVMWGPEYLTCSLGLLWPESVQVPLGACAFMDAARA